MEYLIVDSGTPQPKGKSIWSARIENAVQFSSFDDANAQKDAAEDDTEVIRVNDKWALPLLGMLALIGFIALFMRSTGKWRYRSPRTGRSLPHFPCCCRDACAT